MRTHDTLAVANWFLAKAEAEGIPLSPMKLQKLIYFAHGWALALTHTALINERPQAWDYGPVIPTVYHEFKEFGRNAITRRGSKLIPVPNQDFSADLSPLGRLLNTEYQNVEPMIENDSDAEKLLTRVWEIYGKLTAIQLSNMTHTAGSAWDEAYKQTSGQRGMVISDVLIEAEFRKKIRPANAGTERPAAAP